MRKLKPGLLFTRYQIRDGRPVFKHETELIFDSDITLQRYLHLCRLFNVGAKENHGMFEYFTAIDTRDFYVWGE